MAVGKVVHLDVEERRALGRQARDRVPPDAHRGWEATEDRADPVDVLDAQNATRDADLVPVRHGRMSVSPFTFYRGSAAVMAGDLARTPTAGLRVQLCGDAHLSNFGGYASPERRLVFDLNDFDETLPGPFEYDVKRMAASFTIAARNNGFPKAEVKAVTKAAVRAYREAMAEFAGMRTLDIWYAHKDESQILAAAASSMKGRAAAQDLRRAERNIRKSHTRDSLQALSKLAERVDGSYQIISQPPVVVPFRDLAEVYGMAPDEVGPVIHSRFRDYRATLPADRRQLLERFRIIDAARKVVGVGSVGTRAFIVLLQGRDEDDPLFLQVKEATSSVLEAHLPHSRFRQHGERVVQGQRMMQAASDIFLGWTKGRDENRHFYWRQLRDMKASVLVELLSPSSLGFYAGLCGWTLARAHARSGDPVAIAEYLGTDDAFDRAITSFSRKYADQNEQDYVAFTAAATAGRIQATPGL